MLGLLAPAPAKFPLTVASIMRGTALIGRSPSNLRWSADGSKLFFNWGKADGTQNPQSRQYSVNRDGSQLQETDEFERAVDQIPVNAARQGSLRLYSQRGQLVLFNEATNSTRRFGSVAEPRGNATFLTGGKAIAFTQGDNYFRLDLATGAMDQLTDIHPATKQEVAEQPQEPSESQKTLSTEEGDLFKYTGGGGFAGGGGGFRRRRRGGGGGGGDFGAVSIAIPVGFSFGGGSISPSGKWLAAIYYSGPSGNRPTIVPNYVTRSGYTEDIPSYDKVGDRQGTAKLQLIDLTSGATVDLKSPREADPRGVRWAPDTDRLVVWSASQDHKDDWLESFDGATGKFSELYDEHNPAWVGGPDSGVLGWLPDGKRFYFKSEKTGYSQLYTMAADGADLRAITSGQFEVFQVEVDPKEKRFVFVSSEGSPFLRHLDSVDLEGGTRTKLADLSADEESTYAVSPNGRTVATVRSTSNRPPELFIGSKQVTTTPTPEWLSGPWIDPPIISIKARDGVDVPAHLYKPANWKKGGPAVIFVHGAGYLQNVYEGWSYYYREYMFHHILNSLGYMVIDMDYRGSAGYGADWRTAIYRHMGGKDLDDQVDGAKWLVETQGVAKDRIGIYGGSYGGFITLMAMFTQPGVFAAGAALRPVSDWANYNDGYTGEILNLPQNDREAYKKSSPIYFAEGLKGSLLICHGMVDTNVHFQDSVRLVEKLIELGKKDWELAPYPVEDHSFVHPESWTDEYSRILALFERTIGPHRERPHEPKPLIHVSS